MTVDKFVVRDTINPIYFDTGYYVVPDGDAGVDVYAVLRDAIAPTGTAARSTTKGPSSRMYNDGVINRADAAVSDTWRRLTQPQNRYDCKHLPTLPPLHRDFPRPPAARWRAAASSAEQSRAECR